MTGLIAYSLALALLAAASLFWAATIPQAWALGCVAGFVLTEMWRRRGQVLGPGRVYHMDGDEHTGPDCGNPAHFDFDR